MSMSAVKPGRSMSMSQLRHTVQMRERVVEACPLVESCRNARSVRIVTPRQLTRGELQRYQPYAAGCHVSQVVESRGMTPINPDAGEGA